MINDIMVFLTLIIKYIIGAGAVALVSNILISKAMRDFKRQKARARRVMEVRASEYKSIA